MYKPYSIWTPEFDPLSGGIRVMWGLFGWLLTKGQLAITNGKWKTPFTAIYPEITHGNPLEGQKVIRYILNKPGVMRSYGIPGPMVFDKTDEIYVFSKLYDTFGVDDEHLMFLPILNLHIFQDQKRNRKNTCYFVGKGKDLGLHPKSAIKIDRKNQTDQEQLADVLNTCTIMYTYENPTAMVELARLCGCKVVFFSKGASTNYTEDQLTFEYEPGMEGVGWNKEVDFDYMKFRRTYYNLLKVFEEKLERFISHTQV